MATIREREIRRYRRRLHRIVSLYLALKALASGFNCIVLSRAELLKFFDMDNTPWDRMVEIQKHMKPWFKGFKPYYREKDNTYVNWLFLSQSGDISFLPEGSNLSANAAVMRRLVAALGGERIAIALLSDLIGAAGVPTQRDMVTELTLLTAGLMSPETFSKSKV